MLTVVDKFESRRHDSEKICRSRDSTSCEQLVNPKGSAPATPTGGLLGQDLSSVLMIIFEIMTNRYAVFLFHSD